MKTYRVLLFALLMVTALIPGIMADESPPMPTPSGSTPVAPSAQEHYNQGLQWQKDRQYAKAIEAYRQAVQLKPDFPEAYNNLGYTYRMAGDFDNAIAAYQEALRLKPDFAEAHQYLGKAYLAKGMRQEAEEQYRILRTLNPTMAATLLELMRK